MARRICILLAAGALFAPGCKDPNFKWDWWKKDKPPEEGAAAADEDATPEERELERLREESRSLKERLTEDQNRSALLARKVKQQELISTQLRKQLEAVGDAPLERDRCKVKCIRLEQHIKELENQLAELMKLQMSSTTRPAGT